MKRLGAALLFCASMAQAEVMVMPSGLAVEYLDQILEQQSDGETWLTLRFVSPQIGAEAGDWGYEQVAEDIDHLCDQIGLRVVAEAGPVDQVLITLMDRAVERGVHDPEATMFIGAYLPTESGCVWQ